MLIKIETAQTLKIVAQILDAMREASVWHTPELAFMASEWFDECLRQSSALKFELLDAELFDEVVILPLIFLLEISQVCATIRNHFE